MREDRRRRLMSAMLALAAGAGALVVGSMAQAQPQFYYDWTAPREYAALENPIAPSEESLAAGEGIYKARCLTCHGPEGDGEAVSTDSLRTLPGDLTDRRRMNKYSDGTLFWKIRVGRGDMPPWQLVLKDEEIWHVINFIRGFSTGDRGTATK